MTLTPDEVDRFFAAHFQNAPSESLDVIQTLCASKGCCDAAGRISSERFLLSLLRADTVGNSYIAGIAVGLAMGAWLADIRELDKISRLEEPNASS